MLEKRKEIPVHGGVSQKRVSVCISFQTATAAKKRMQTKKTAIRNNKNNSIDVLNDTNDNMQ